MLKQTLLILTLTLVGSGTFAETINSENHQQKLVNKLNLTETQIGPVQDVLSEQKEKRQAILEEMKTQMEALRAETNQKLSGVLTAEQMQTLETIQTARQEKRQQRKEEWKQRRLNQSENG